MAQGPDGDGFKQGHRASASLYADKSDAEATTTDKVTVSEEKASASGVAGAGVAVDATTASEEDVSEALAEEKQETGET